MSPQQIHGLWVCFTLSVSCVIICPALMWTLSDRTKRI